MKNACPNSPQRLTRRTRRTWPSTRSTYEDCSYRAPAHLRATKVHFSRGFPRAPARVWATQYSRMRSEEHTSELQSRLHLVCRLLLEKKKNTKIQSHTFQSSRI